MTRGELWWADFGIPFGSEPGYKRPVLIIQNDFRRAMTSAAKAALSLGYRLSLVPGDPSPQSPYQIYFT